MKRFYFGDDEEENEEDAFDEEKFLMPDAAELIAMTHLESTNESYLNYSIKICEKSFLWKFYGISKKIDMINKVYQNLKQITESDV